jgi:hypothetical protein
MAAVAEDELACPHEEWTVRRIGSRHATRLLRSLHDRGSRGWRRLNRHHPMLDLYGIRCAADGSQLLRPRFVVTVQDREARQQATHKNDHETHAAGYSHDRANSPDTIEP